MGAASTYLYSCFCFCFSPLYSFATALFTKMLNTYACGWHTILLLCVHKGSFIAALLCVF